MKRSAFTLIEMMVVVAIIGLLTATAVLGFGRQRATARETRRIQDISTINDALQQHMALGGTIPDTSWTPVNSGLLDFLITTGLLNSIPNEQNPSSGNVFWCANYVYWSLPAQQLDGMWSLRGVAFGSNQYMVGFGAELTGTPSPQYVHPLNNNVWSYDTKYEPWCNGDRGLGILHGTSK